MCINSGPKATPPAASPAPALPAATSVEVGEARKKENLENFGKIGGPSYRVKRTETAPQMTGSQNLKM